MSVHPTSEKRTTPQLADSATAVAARAGLADALANPDPAVAADADADADADANTGATTDSQRPAVSTASHSRARVRGPAVSAPISGLLRIQDRLDVVQMIDRELSVVAPLPLRQRCQRVGHDAQRLTGGIASEQRLCRALEIVQLIERRGDVRPDDEHTVIGHQQHGLSPA